MRVALAFIKRDFLSFASYKTNFVLQMLSIFAVVPLFYFMGELFTSSGSEFLEQWEGNYFAFLLIGVAFLDYHAVSLRSFSQSLRESQLMGTLEIVLLSPTSLANVLVYSSLWAYLFTTGRFVLYLLVGLLFGLDLHDSNIIGAVIVLFLGVLSFAAFGIISASVIMLIKRGAVINTALSAASLFFGGVLYPTSVLPGWLQPISKVLPITHALEGMRLALLQGNTTVELLPQMGILVLMAVILFPLSLASFHFSVKRTKATGTLAQY